MQLSFTSSDGNRDVITLEVAVADLSYDDFLKTVGDALGLKSDVSYEVTVDGKTYTKEDVAKAGNTVKAMNLKENDLLVLSPIVNLELTEITDNERTNLIRSVHIPKSRRLIREEVTYARDGQALYMTLKTSPPHRLQGLRREFSEQLPGLLEQYERRPNDKWGFLIAYRNACLRRDAEVKRLGSVGVQRRMEQDRQRQRLQQNAEEAMMETPEAFVHIEMLYISIKLNGVEGKAFVDTGAAKSLISREFAEKCNLADLINPTNAFVFRGVGGSQQSDGTIWRCDMTVENHELPVTLHVMPRGHAVHQVLIGLDLLLRHRAHIDLQTRTLVFQGGVSTPFLSDVESAKLREAEMPPEMVDEAMETDEAAAGSSKQQQ